MRRILVAQATARLSGRHNGSGATYPMSNRSLNEAHRSVSEQREFAGRAYSHTISNEAAPQTNEAWTEGLRSRGNRVGSGGSHPA